MLVIISETGEYVPQDTDDNKEFESLMKELEEPAEGEGDWSILDQPAEGEEDDGVDIDDPDIESLVEGIGEDGTARTEEPNLDELTRSVASKKTSLQKLAEELAKGFLA